MVVVTVIIVVLVLLALAAAAYSIVQKRQREELQTRFGPEYDRQVEASGSRRQAEQHLAGVADKRDKLRVRDLDESERARWTTEWDAVQARFVDEPAAAVDSAEELINRVMRDRGYPVEDFDEQADLVAVDHQDVVSHYREAHSAHERHRTTGSLDTEDLRQAFVHYRALFTELVHPGTSPDSATHAATPTGDHTAPPAEAGTDHRVTENAETGTGTVGAHREAAAAADDHAEHHAEHRAELSDTDRDTGSAAASGSDRGVTDADLDRHQETR